MPKYIYQASYTVEGMRGLLKDSASGRRKAQNTLILWQVAQQEKLEVTETDIRSHVAKLLPVGTDDSKIDSFAKKMAARLKENLLFEKAMDFLIANAKITDIPASL